WHIGDLAAAAAPLGLFFGRLANFVNGELWGNITTVRWAVIFPKAPHIATEATVYYETALGSGYANPRHPSTLYEAALEGIVLGTILIWLFWRKNGALPKALPGLLSGLFLILYAAARMFCERFREPDAGLILGLSRGTFYSLFMIVAGAGIIMFALFRGRHPPLRDSHPENDNTNV
ncbi:MAG TPA: prolipoprotein diacylglyceryl transferase, partial [Opitutales bacterium]|nr:prolipoprotein diacylglyceryl transferase [Opitutales bacterium]